MNRLRSQRGIALAVAILALVIIGVTVAAAFFVGSQEQRIGLNTLSHQQAFVAAEAANDQLLASWSRDVFNSLPVGGTVLTAGAAAGGQGWYRQRVQRLSPILYLVRTDGFSRDSAARQVVGALVRLYPLQLNIGAALTAAGPVRIRGWSHISGIDRVPEGWAGCPATLDTLPGIRVPPSAPLELPTCLALDCLQGQPTVDSTAPPMAEISFQSLRAHATKVLPGGQYQVHPSGGGGVCDIDVPENWGEPLSPGVVARPAPVAECRTHFPMVWLDTSATLTHGRGQGVLVVNGDLDVQGEFEFSGPVFVRGSLRAGGGVRFTGGVVAADVSGEMTIVLSRCAVTRATDASAPVTLLPSRGWLGLY